MLPATAPGGDGFVQARRASNMKMTLIARDGAYGSAGSKRLSKVHSRNTHRGKYVGFTSGSVLLIMNGMKALPARRR